MTDEITLEESFEALKKDESGKYIIPTDASKEMKVALNAEARRRETQADYTKKNQENKKLKSMNELLHKAFEDNFLNTSKIPDDIIQLKEEDPDAYIKYIVEHKEKTKQDFITKSEELKSKAETESKNYELEVIVDAYNKENQDAIINDEVVKNDLPPRLLNDLNNGDIDIHEFLSKAKKILKKHSKIKTNQTENSPTMHKSSSAYTSTDDIKNEASKEYRNYIF